MEKKNNNTNNHKKKFPWRRYDKYCFTRGTNIRYPRTIVDIRPEHEDPHRVRITAGGK